MKSRKPNVDHSADPGATESRRTDPNDELRFQINEIREMLVLLLRHHGAKISTPTAIRAVPNDIHGIFCRCELAGNRNRYFCTRNHCGHRRSAPSHV